jgi:hypothetical protein
MAAMRKAFEAYFHTPEDVRRYLADALNIVDGAELTDDLREPAFVQAVNLLSQKQVTFEQVSPAGILLNQHPQG